MDQRPPRGSLRGPLASRRLRPVTAEGRHALVEVNAPAGRSSRGRGVRPFDRTPIVFACLPGPAPLSPRHSTPEPMHAEPDQAPSDPSWRTASQALDDLMRKLLVVHRPLEAEERLAKRRPGSDGRWPPPRVDRRPVPQGQRGSPDGGQGVRSSWETAVRRVFFCSSKAASRRAVSRWAMVWSVMSTYTPCQ
jgi:hypothetical protein